MGWQLTIVLIVIALAAVYVALKTWRTWHPPKGSCGGGCGCASKSPVANEERPILIPEDQLTLRQRP